MIISFFFPEKKITLKEAGTKLKAFHCEHYLKRKALSFR